MPKRKRVSAQTKSKRLRKADTTSCPLLPQELWDRIIDFSIAIDPVLGVLPREVHQPFTSPFMRVNQAFRGRVLSIIASSTWIEIKSNDHGHADFVYALANCFPVVDPFWVISFLQPERTSRIFVEFGRKVARTTTRQYEHDTKSFVIPCAFSVLLRMLSEIDILQLYYVNPVPVLVKSDKLLGARLRDLELLLSLRLAKDVSLDSTFEYLLEPTPLTVSDLEDPLPLIIAHRIFVNSKLQDKNGSVTGLRRMLVYLYTSRDLDAYASDYLDRPSSWSIPRMFLDRHDWQSNMETNKHFQIVWSSYKFEAAAFRYFRELLKTDRDWIVWQSPFLTDNFDRWIVEPPFTYYGLPDDDMATFLHDAGMALTLFLELQGWPNPDLRRNSSSYLPLSPTYIKVRNRVSFFQCATRLKPSNEIWRQDYLNAKNDLSNLFPNVIESWSDHQVISYTDAEGRGCKYFSTPVVKRDYAALTYVHRAQQIVKNLQSEIDEVEATSGAAVVDDA